MILVPDELKMARRNLKATDAKRIKALRTA